MKIIKDLIHFFKFPALLFILAITLRFLGIYSIYPWLDIPLHLVGGILIAHSFILIFEDWQKKSYMSIPNKLIYILLIISIVALITILWEFWEFLMTQIFKSEWQGNLEDTMLDFLLGLIGGFLMAVYNKINFNKNKHIS